MWCAADNHNYMYCICAKGYINSNFNQALIEYQIFTKLPQIHIFTKIVILKVYKFYDRDMKGTYFFIFASCEPFKSLIFRE